MVSLPLIDDEAIFPIWNRAASIPELGGGGATIAPTLVKLAREVDPRYTIADIGPFLGSTTAYLVMGRMLGGATGAPIHCYDRWFASDAYRDKAWSKLKLALPRRESFWRMWAESVIDLPCDIHSEVGDVYAGDSVPDRPIGMLVDDMTSGTEALDLLFGRFWTSLVHGAPIVMMDYYFYETQPSRPELHETVAWFEEQHAWFDGPERAPGPRNTAAVFRFRGGNL
jgi:hypothetical protein